MKIIRKKKLIGNDSDTLLTNAVIGDVQKIMRFPFIETIITTHQILLKLVLKNLIQKKKKFQIKVNQLRDKFLFKCRVLPKQY